MRTTRRFGWRPSHPSMRAPILTLAEDETVLPPVEDLRPYCTPHGDQGNIGQCTGAASVWGLLEYMREKQGEPYVRLSALFAYYNARLEEGSTDWDAGATIADVMDGIMKYGVCPEDMWPSDREDRVTVKPSQACYDAAIQFKGLMRREIAQTRGQIRAALSSGLPIIFGFDVSENFMGEQIELTGVMPMPHGSIIGGHAVDVIGHGLTIPSAPDNPYYPCRNSWEGPGNPWGDHGDFYMPEKFILSGACSEFTVLQQVT
jgi:C1A family cysteine protease